MSLKNLLLLLALSCVYSLLAACGGRAPSISEQPVVEPETMLESINSALAEELALSPLALEEAALAGQQDKVNEVHPAASLSSTPSNILPSTDVENQNQRVTFDMAFVDSNTPYLLEHLDDVSIQELEEAQSAVVDEIYDMVIAAGGAHEQAELLVTHFRFAQFTQDSDYITDIELTYPEASIVTAHDLIPYYVEMGLIPADHADYLMELPECDLVNPVLLGEGAMFPGVSGEIEPMPQIEWPFIPGLSGDDGTPCLPAPASTLTEICETCFNGSSTGSYTFTAQSTSTFVEPDGYSELQKCGKVDTAKPKRTDIPLLCRIETSSPPLIIDVTKGPVDITVFNEDVTVCSIRGVDANQSFIYCGNLTRVEVLARVTEARYSWVSGINLR